MLPIPHKPGFGVIIFATTQPLRNLIKNAVAVCNTIDAIGFQKNPPARAFLNTIYYQH